jgi:hypothetical protein
LSLFDGDGKILIAKPDEGEDGPEIARHHLLESDCVHPEQGFYVDTRMTFPICC